MSTILKALRKLEEDQPERPGASSMELHRQILARGRSQEGSERSRPWRRVALVVTAVLFSGVAGVGVTLVALSYWQTSLFALQSEAMTADVEMEDAAKVMADVAAAPSDFAPASTPDLAEQPSVVIVADVLKRRDAAFDETAASTFDRVESAESTPVAIYNRQQGPISRLAAAREARMTRAPIDVRSQVAYEEPAPAEPEPVQIAAVRVEVAPAEPLPVPVVQDEPVEASAPPALPEIAREPVPSVAVVSTVWHPRRERRRAEFSVEEGGEIRTVELREGDFLGPLRLSEIGPIGVTFELEGVEVEHRVGGTRR